MSNETLTERSTAPLSVTEAPVIVGHSGTDESHDALALTRELARLMRSPVVAVSGATSAPVETNLRTHMAERRKQTERLRAETKNALAGLDDVEPVAVLAPSPARELDRIADERGAARVVLGSSHRGPIRRVVPGAVADRLLAGGSHPVLRASACPLIVTPGPDRVPASAEPQRSPAEVISALMSAPMTQSIERSKEEIRP